ncbi:hypothetical protein RJ639_025166 [Escallonia herrerae]|uniref:Uncharacterized protein n=1 Tax=Escallonia herrerae TaxID=1293975 RepID=A0AA88S6E5_9ASTE|nr:hypothetical protein RJ639_025166 [Escallonia herrerae]
MPSSTLLVGQKWPANFVHTLALSEVRKQLRIAVPLVAMNLLWFARISITTAFLGRLGKLDLVGGTLGFTFANVTGFSVLNGLCSAMESKVVKAGSGRKEGGGSKEPETRSTGCLANAKQAVGVLAIVLNFDYMLYSVNISLTTVASICVSNELGANKAGHAYQSATVALAVSSVLSCIGGFLMVAARGTWGQLFSNDKGLIRGVKKTMLLMASVEVANFPLAVCGGIVRGTAKPWTGTYTNLAGFYLLALPLGVILAFKVHLGLGGLLTGFLVGAIACLVLLVVSVARIDWVEEAGKAQVLVHHAEANRDGDHKKPATVENNALIELERSKS